MIEFKTSEDVLKTLEKCKYICDRPLATAIFLSLKMDKPLFLEGEAGVGKTEVAKVLSQVLDTRLIRLQCYEGLDVSTSLYEWNYPKQILSIKLAEAHLEPKERVEQEIFSEEFLIRRPLLEAIQNEEGSPPVLLIDEIDRSDEEFEAFLLEVLSDFQITIPEIGTIKAKHKPSVVITSNRTREIRDALKRRCLYHWIEYPSFAKESQIILTKVRGIDQDLADQICHFMQLVRQGDYLKRPGIAETLDWASALLYLNKDSLDKDALSDTVGCIFKYKEDLDRMEKEGVESILDQVMKHCC